MTPKPIILFYRKQKPTQKLRSALAEEGHQNIETSPSQILDSLQVLIEPPCSRTLADNLNV